MTNMKLKIIKSIYSFFLNDNHITWLIVINCFVTFLLAFSSIPLWLHDRMVTIDLILTIIFGIEIAIKVKIYGKRFFKKHINTFDFILVVISLLPLFFGSYLERMDYLLVLRTVRIFKCTRLFRAIPNYERLLLNLKIAFCLIVLIGGMFGMSFVTSSFTDELAVDNNDNVMKELQELKEMIKKQNEKLGDND